MTEAPAPALEPGPAPAFAFDNSYARLPDRFHARLAPVPVAAPRLLALNAELAALLGLDPAALAGPEGVAILAGNRVPAGAEPLAMAYAGHQFGAFVPSLGDGRAILLGEVTGRDGVRRDIQLKGSGRTPFSRMGDGRAALGPVLREYLVSEAMAAQGIPSTRALAALLTGEPVRRETLLPGAILVRVARSHVRVGTFEYFAVRRDAEALGLLADHVLARLRPDLAGRPDRVLALLEAVIAGQAALVARWMGTGFIHGVMNTDNMSVACETIDFGPCAFMDRYHPLTVYSSIDHHGRYAFANQPRVAHWNLAKLAGALLPIIDADEAAALRAAQAAIDRFPELFETEWTAVLRAKLGLGRAEAEDRALAEALLKLMEDDGADFTLAFRALGGAARGEADGFLALFPSRNRARDWLGAWRVRLDREAGGAAARAPALDSANPALIPRNHRVEQAIGAAMLGDLGPFRRLHAALARPFEERAEDADLGQPPAPGEEVRETFCGT